MTKRCNISEVSRWFKISSQDAPKPPAGLTKIACLMHTTLGCSCKYWEVPNADKLIWAKHVHDSPVLTFVEGLSPSPSSFICIKMSNVAAPVVMGEG
eukprot:9945025-Ditylum_brightwellii.AAC.1